MTNKMKISIRISKIRTLCKIGFCTWILRLEGVYTSTQRGNIRQTSTLEGSDGTAEGLGLRRVVGVLFPMSQQEGLAVKVATTKALRTGR